MENMCDQIARLPASLEEIQETFAFLEDWEERYGFLIDMGRKMSPLEEALKTEAFRVRGCQSQVWLVPQADGERLYFRGDSDAVIVQGLVAVMLAIYSGKTAEDILAVDARAILDQLELQQHLSPLRANGLFSMVERIRNIATHYIKNRSVHL